MADASIPLGPPSLCGEGGGKILGDTPSAPPPEGRPPLDALISAVRCVDDGAVLPRKDAGVIGVSPITYNLPFSCRRRGAHKRPCRDSFVCEAAHARKIAENAQSVQKTTLNKMISRRVGFSQDFPTPFAFRHLRLSSGEWLERLTKAT